MSRCFFARAVRPDLNLEPGKTLRSQYWDKDFTKISAGWLIGGLRTRGRFFQHSFSAYILVYQGLTVLPETIYAIVFSSSFLIFYALFIFFIWQKQMAGQVGQ